MSSTTRTAVFRADASVEIGTGHVMRCLTLADALRREGTECIFICRPHPGNLLDQITARGHKTIALSGSRRRLPEEADSRYADWLGGSVEDDAIETMAALGDSCPDWLVVDHYAIDARWESRLRVGAARILAIDDLADRSHDCDILLDQNLGRERASYAGLVATECRVLAGPAYALLRPEFARLRLRSLERPPGPPLRRVLVSLGGMDKENATGVVLEGLAAAQLPDDLRVTVVMGRNAPWTEQVRKQADAMPRPTEVLVGVPNLAELMADCELAFGAAGGMAWERCCLGLPTLIVVLADNQRAGALALQRAGASLTLGETSPLRSDIAAKMREVGAPGVLESMRRACAAITDGAGTARVVQELDHVCA